MGLAMHETSLQLTLVVTDIYK